MSSNISWNKKWDNKPFVNVYLSHLKTIYQNIKHPEMKNKLQNGDERFPSDRSGEVIHVWTGDDSKTLAGNFQD